MSGHDEFCQLAALAAIGQISAAEHDDLTVHFRGCPECREAYADYARILRQDLPQASPARFRTRQSSVHPASDDERRERFLARARAHGADFSPEVETGSASPAAKPAPVFLMRWALAAAAVVIAVGATLSFVFHERRAIPAPPSNLGALVAQNEALTRELDEIRRKLAVLNGRLSPPSSHERNLAGALSEKEAQLGEAKRNLDRLSAELDQMRAKNAALRVVREYDESAVAELTSRVQQLEASNANSVASLVELQDKIRSLNAALEAQSQKLMMERQLATVSSDVRQLMGARNLHIVDVHDVDGGGKAAKSFGRVFYSESESLVFYAFDLPNGKLTPAKYHFQAWGQQEGQVQSVRNLGTFSVDDHEQHRWVLKVSDAALLRGIDSVFVTAETLGDAGSPRGKRILYAYLAGRANHP